MLFQFILLAYAKTISLSSLDVLKEFEGQCHPRWSFVDSPFKLSQLIVAFRHGSRAPLKAVGTQWMNKKCKTCATECATVECQDGMLTLEGFYQSKELGSFISRFYVPRFSSFQGVLGFYSKIGRTFATLSGVIEGIGIKNTKTQIESSLVSNLNSAYVKNVLTQQVGMNTEKNKVGSYYIYDNLITSLCSNTSFECSSFSCSPEKIYDLMKKQERQFIESTERTRTNLTANGISLGKFGGFLQKAISGRNNIVLVSGHDSTLIKLLIGLGIKLGGIPAYSSAVFLEVWEQPDGKEFVRVVYNGNVQKIGLYKEEYVEVEKFETYLSMFNQLNDVLDSSTSINSESINPPYKINEMVQSAKEVYKPLLTELKNRNIIKNSSLISESVAEDQKIGFKKILSGLVGSMRQFLFEGWFGSKKNEAKNTMEIKIETKDKDTGETKQQIIECDKNGKGNCHAVPKKNEGKNIIEVKIETKDKDTGETKYQAMECDKNGNCHTPSSDSNNKKDKSDEGNKLDSSKPKKQEACPCEESKSRKCGSERETCNEKMDKCKKEKPSCQVKAMLENSCSVEESQCGADEITCNSKPSSAFDGLPGTCKTFTSNYEAFPPTCPCTKQPSPVLPDGGCRNPIPGVEILG